MARFSEKCGAMSRPTQHLHPFFYYRSYLEPFVLTVIKFRMKSTVKQKIDLKKLKKV